MGNEDSVMRVRRKENGLEVIERIVRMKKQYGEDRVSGAIDDVMAWYDVYGDERCLDIIVSDRFIMVVPLGAKSPADEAFLSVHIPTGSVVIDVVGFFGETLTHKDAEESALCDFIKTGSC
jgi:hypothetical protein